MNNLMALFDSWSNSLLLLVGSPFVLGVITFIVFGGIVSIFKFFVRGYGNV